MTPSDRRKILVVRNDKLGDFMLAWPALAALKGSLPQCEVHALVSGYTAEMAHLCPSIDRVIVDPGGKAGLAAQVDLVRRLRRERYAASITLFSTTRVGWILLSAGIPRRIAPATKFAQIFHNRRVTQRRSRSEKPEYAYNLDLAIRYLEETGVPCREGRPPWLEFPRSEIETLRQEFCHARGIDAGRRLVFIHPGSGGSARNLSLEQYARLGRALSSSTGHEIIVSAGPGEIGQAQRLGTLLDTTPHTVYHSTEGLDRFARHIAFCDLFIGGSTGPLHIAGALNCNTAAFYPRRRSSTALRWRTINGTDRQLAFSPPEDADDEDMTSIDMKRTAAEISARFLN